MATPTVYVICDQNCKFEGMTKEQILTAIMQAVTEGEIHDVDAGFITTVKTINGLPLKFFVGEQSAYDALSEEEKTNLFALITNETQTQDLLDAIKAAHTKAMELETLVQNIIGGLTYGDFIVESARYAEYATDAENAVNATNAANAENAKVADRALETDFSNGTWFLADPEITLYDGTYEFYIQKASKRASFGVITVEKGDEVVSPIVLFNVTYNKPYTMLKIGAEGTDEILIKLLSAIELDDLLGNSAEVNYSTADVEIWYRRLR